MKRLAAVLLALPSFLSAQARDTTLKIAWGGFVDAYYAWDFGEPPDFDRSFAGGALFTTQPARHDEFNVNLAFVEVKADGPRLRGRLAVQAGTSVQSNYLGEPTIGLISGPLLSRIVQEAVAGVKIADNLWVDGGIFFSHMGMESWISRDNPTYTRSLVAEYSPYYSSGVRAVLQATSKLTAHLHVVNGWQNISENNTGKGAGIRLDYAAMPSTTVSYYNFFSDEAGNRLRTFNGIGAKGTLGNVTLLGQLDVGTQSESSASGGTATWYGLTAIARLPLSSTTAVTARFERYDDDDQVIIATGSAVPGVANGPFRGNGASLGLDMSLVSGVVWRSELRGFWNKTAVFPDGTSGAPRKADGFIVSSLGLTF